MANVRVIFFLLTLFFIFVYNFYVSSHFHDVLSHVALSVDFHFVKYPVPVIRRPFTEALQVGDQLLCSRSLGLDMSFHGTRLSFSNYSTR